MSSVCIVELLHLCQQWQICKAFSWEGNSEFHFALLASYVCLIRKRKRYLGLHLTWHTFYTILTKFVYSRQISVNICDSKIYKNTCNGSSGVIHLCRRTERQIGWQKVIHAFCDCVNAPSNACRRLQLDTFHVFLSCYAGKSATSTRSQECKMYLCHKALSLSYIDISNQKNAGTVISS